MIVCHPALRQRLISAAQERTAPDLLVRGWIRVRTEQALFASELAWTR